MTEAEVRLAQLLGQDPSDHVGLYRAATRLKQERDEALAGSKPITPLPERLAAMLRMSAEDIEGMLTEVARLRRLAVGDTRDREQEVCTADGRPPPGPGWVHVGMQAEALGPGPIDNVLDGSIFDDQSATGKTALWIWRRTRLSLEEALAEEGLELLDTTQGLRVTVQAEDGSPRAAVVIADVGVVAFRDQASHMMETAKRAQERSMESKPKSRRART
jgi:hypothetical protein